MTHFSLLKKWVTHFCTYTGWLECKLNIIMCLIKNIPPKKSRNNIKILNNFDGNELKKDHRLQIS